MGTLVNLATLCSIARRLGSPPSRVHNLPGSLTGAQGTRFLNDATVHTHKQYRLILCGAKRRGDKNYRIASNEQQLDLAL